ncbi:hypothetical protein ACSSVY_004157 [Roseovarius sp. MBR-51]
MRELVTITNSTVDVSDPGSRQTGDLWLAVAQSLGVKVEKEKREAAIAQAQELVQSGGAFRPAVDLMKLWLDEEGMGQFRQKRLVSAIRDAGKPVTMKTIHALLTVAQMEQAHKLGGEALTQFQTSLALEADGVTDGPINAMVHMFSGTVDEWYLKTLAKGGWFFDGTTRTLNEQRAKDEDDLYHEGAALFDRGLADYLGGLKDEAKEDALRVYRVLDALLDGFDAKSEKAGADPRFASDRAVVKNPLTVMIYGSAKKGTVGKPAYSGKSGRRRSCCGTSSWTLGCLRLKEGSGKLLGFRSKTSEFWQSQTQFLR